MKLESGDKSGVGGALTFNGAKNLYWRTRKLAFKGCRNSQCSVFGGAGGMQCQAFRTRCGRPHKRGTTPQCARQCR